MAMKVLIIRSNFNKETVIRMNSEDDEDRDFTIEVFHKNEKVYEEISKDDFIQLIFESDSIVEL